MATRISAHLPPVPLRHCLLLACLSVAAMAASNYTRPYTLVPWVGDSSIGSADGPGSAARFYFPVGIATDLSGNVYITDRGNQTIRKITPTGQVSTLAGMPGLSGGPDPQDGIGSTAHFSDPYGLTVDPAGNIYVTDFNGYAIRKISPAGVVSTVVRRDSTVPNAWLLDHAWGITRDLSGNLYYADWSRFTIGKISPVDGVTKVAGQDYAPATVDSSEGTAQFNYPAGITVDAAGSLYVSEWAHGAIRKITPNGTVTTLPASPGLTDAYSTGLAMDAGGNLIVAGSATSVIGKITPNGTATIIAGNLRNPGYQDGPAAAALFQSPQGVALDPAGNLFVVETNNVVRKITPAGQVSTFAGLALPAAIGSRDGAGLAARFSEKCHVVTTPAGDLVVSDYDNRTIRKVTPDGMVTTLAGAVGESAYVDGPGATARFMGPWHLTVEASGNIFVFDQGRIRKITPAGLVSTIVNTVEFSMANGLTVDASGNLFLAGDHSIKRISPGGNITDFAGLYLPQPYTYSAAGSADGTGSAARFNTPAGIAIDGAGNLFVADSGNSTIRKITPDRVVTTFAGTAGSNGSDDGLGSAARFFNPQGLTIDDAGNLYVTDAYNDLIRMITPDGMVSTVAGLARANGNAGGTGADARLHWPQSIAVDRSGNLYASNFSMIYKGLRSAAPLITAHPQSQTVATGTNVQFSVTAAGTPAPTYQWYFNGSAFNGATASTLSFGNARSSDAGDYTVVVVNPLGGVTSNKATLTVTSTPAPAPMPATGNSGGGAIGASFVLALLVLGATHRFRTKLPG